MSAITVKLDWRTVDVMTIQRALNARFHGRRVWFGVGFAALFVGGLAYAGLHALPPHMEPTPSGTLAVLLGVFVFVLLVQRLHGRLVAAMMAAPVRQEVSQVTLTAEGIAAPGALVAGRIPWRWVTGIVEREEALLVMFSPMEFIPLADAGLPEGMTRDRLRAQIETWREAAK